MNKRNDALLAAAKYVDGPCILSMSDHLYESGMVRTLARLPVPAARVSASGGE